MAAGHGVEPVKRRPIDPVSRPRVAQAPGAGPLELAFGLAGSLVGLLLKAFPAGDG